MTDLDEADRPDAPTEEERSDGEIGTRIDVGILVAHSPGVVFLAAQPSEFVGEFAP